MSKAVLPGAGVILICRRLGAFTEPDPLFLFLMLLIHCSPTAINIQVIHQLAGPLMLWCCITRHICW